MLPVLLVLFSLIAVYLFLVFPAIRRHPHRQFLDGQYIAHRGLHDLCNNTPENSLAAFQKAVEAGLAAECDIHLTADGEVVVFHDDTLSRMCGNDGVVEQLTLDELRKYRLQNTNQAIPTLRELLALIDGRVSLLIELKAYKGNDCALCEAADAILREYHGIYFVQSFYPLALRWYKRHRPDVCRGQLSSGFKGEALLKKLAARLLFNFLSRPDFVSYDHEYAPRLSLSINIMLGAFPVGWTFRSAEAVKKYNTQFCTYIFELFNPDDH